jgi:dTDP-6-deoxy-L-talose 4-dehydrogenase (NAD+)
VAKNALRQSLMLYAEKKDVCLHWLRAFYIYGDDLWGSSIFSKLCMAEEEGNTKFPFTSGKNKYDFIHIDELADMIVKASVQTQIDGIINVCTGKPVSLGEKVENFIREHGFKFQLEYGAFPDRKYDSPIVWGNTEKIDLIMRQCDSGREEEI